MAVKPIPITGSVLQWAIHDAGWSEMEFAQELGVSLEKLDSWKHETAQPNSGEFNRIIRLLNRPAEFFLLPAPPTIDRPDTRLRTAPQSRLRDLGPEENRWLRRAILLQEVASWVLRNLQQGPVHFSRTSIAQSAGSIAKSERRYFEISTDEQQEWQSAYSALREWRRALEQRNILVFQLPMGQQRAQGFALWDRWAPVIAINPSYNPESRIFTLFHEYAHLLLQRDDIMLTNASDLPAQVVTAEERWCEHFAAAFLMPQIAVETYISTFLDLKLGERVATFNQVKRVATRFKVSLRAAALRLIELGLGDPDLYGIVAANAVPASGGGGGGGPRRHELRLREYGELLPRILLWASDDGMLSKHDVLDYLQVSRSEIDRIALDLGV